MKNRYSKYIRYILLIIDLLIINILFFLLFDNKKNFSIYLSIFWVISSILLSYYKIHRHTSFYKILSLVFSQTIIFSLGFFAYLGVFKEGVVTNKETNTIIITVVALSIVKILFFILIKNYRKLGKNYRKVVFLEIDNSSKSIMNLFQTKKYLGYNVDGFFQKTTTGDPLFLGSDSDLYNYAVENKIDEIYATLSKLEKKEISNLTKFTSQNNIKLKLIPNSNDLYIGKKEIEVYEDSFKVLSVKTLPFQLASNRLIKRFFDVCFSFLIIFFLMSWLTPILWVLIKLESKGDLFFKQEREGLHGGRFYCYKFRSMNVNTDANKVQASKNDMRITKIGAFIRKTSIDELPQFFNVFLGDMSVVGPRPHMDAHSIQFEQEIKNYIKRHAVKPGITGLAQVSGYRGEIQKPSDIINRVRMDIFYIENWSFLFDIKIIIKTILNVFKGEEKAY